MPRRFARIPLPVRRALLLLGVIAAVAGLPGPAMAAATQASPAASSTTISSAVRPEGKLSTTVSSHSGRLAGARF